MNYEKLRKGITDSFKGKQYVEINEDMINERMQLIEKHEGKDCCYGCEEKVDGINISDYLKKIRYKEKECILLIVIDSGNIVDFFVAEGNSNKQIGMDEFINSGAIEFIKSHLESKEKICYYHNHPNRDAARPSEEDIVSNEYCRDFNGALDYDLTFLQLNTSDLWKESRIPDFCYYDWGVVTEKDFFSSRQKESEIECILAENIMIKKEVQNRNRDIFE